MKLDSDIVFLLGRIHEAKGKQELFLAQKPKELDKLVEIAKIQSTEASNEIEGIRTTNTRLKLLLSEKITPKKIERKKKLLGIVMFYRLFMKVMSIFH